MRSSPPARQELGTAARTAPRPVVVVGVLGAPVMLLLLLVLVPTLLAALGVMPPLR